MDISAQLAADLAALSQALDEDVDLETTVRDFAAAAKLAVTSYLGRGCPDRRRFWWRS